MFAVCVYACFVDGVDAAAVGVDEVDVGAVAVVFVLGLSIWYDGDGDGETTYYVSRYSSWKQGLLQN